MIKRIVYVICTVLVFFCLSFNSNAAEQSKILIELNGNEIKTEESPVIKDNRTLVPLRVIFEAFGAEINWDEQSRTIIGKKNNLTIKLVIDSENAYINDKLVKLDVPATIIDSRTFVPVRFISESLGSIVQWDSQNKKVLIYGMVQGNYENQEKMSDHYIEKLGDQFESLYKIKFSDEDIKLLKENGADFFDVSRDLRSLSELANTNAKVKSVEYLVEQVKKYKEGEDIYTVAMCSDDTKEELALHLVYYVGDAYDVYEGIHCVINGITIGETQIQLQVDGELKDMPVKLMLAGNFYNGAKDFSQEEQNGMLEELLKKYNLTN